MCFFMVVWLQALAQCDGYLRKIGVVKEAVDDTAGAAQMVARQVRILLHTFLHTCIIHVSCMHSHMLFPMYSVFVYQRCGIRIEKLGWRQVCSVAYRCGDDVLSPLKQQMLGW